MHSKVYYHIPVIILLFILAPLALKAQAYWEFQLPNNSKCNLESFSVTPDSCKTIRSGANGYFTNVCKDASLFQDTFVIDNGNNVYEVHALNEVNGKYHVNKLKKQIKICRTYKGVLNGKNVIVHTNEIWYFSAKQREASCTPLKMAVRIKTGKEWINAGFSYKETAHKQTRIYYCK